MKKLFADCSIKGSCTPQKIFFVVLFNSATPTCAHTCAYFQNIFF